jgi:hypothetical protein
MFCFGVDCLQLSDLTGPESAHVMTRFVALGRSSAAFSTGLGWSCVPPIPLVSLGDETPRWHPLTVFVQPSRFFE